jgi:hypothetical protein
MAKLRTNRNVRIYANLNGELNYQTNTNRIKNRNMRKEHLISIDKELILIENLSVEVLEKGFNASNTIVVTVSGDYSSTVGQFIRHNLSSKGEIAAGFCVDVPYPDQKWDSDFLYEL